VVEAKHIPDLVGNRRLEVEAVPARQKDAKVEGGAEDEPKEGEREQARGHDRQVVEQVSAARGAAREVILISRDLAFVAELGRLAAGIERGARARTLAARGLLLQHDLVVRGFCAGRHGDARWG
jgi:hypothetical protein